MNKALVLSDMRWLTILTVYKNASESPKTKQALEALQPMMLQTVEQLFQGGAEALTSAQAVEMCGEYVSLSLSLSLSQGDSPKGGGLGHLTHSLSLSLSLSWLRRSALCRAKE